MRFQQTGLAALMVTVEEEEHGSVAPREAVEEAGAIQTVRTILHHQEDSKRNNRHVPNVAQAARATLQTSAPAVANHVIHLNIPATSVLKKEMNRTGAVAQLI